MNRCTIIKSEFILTLGTKSPSSSSSSSPSSSCSWGNNKMFLSFSSNHWFNRSIYKNKYSVCKWKEQTSSSPSSSSSSSNCIKNNKITKKSQMWNNSDYKFSFCFFSSLQTFCGLCVGTCLCSNVTVVCVCEIEEKLTLSSSSRASPVKYSTALGTILSRKKWPISKSVARVNSESSSYKTRAQRGQFNTATNLSDVTQDNIMWRFYDR